MHLSLCPGLTFEAGRFHTLLGPPTCIESLVREPTVSRFSAVCICPKDSVLADSSSGWGHHCRFVTIGAARDLIWELAGAREPLVVLEHAPTLFEEDGAALRTLTYQIRARSANAMVVLYARLPDRLFDRLARLADRSFAVLDAPMELPAVSRMLVPGQTTLPQV